MIRATVLINRALRKELVLVLAYVTDLVQTNSGGVVYLVSGRSYVVDRKEYEQLKTAMLSWNKEIWMEDTRFDLPKLVTH